MYHGVSSTKPHPSTAGTTGASANQNVATDAITELTQNVDFANLTQVDAVCHSLADVQAVRDFCATVLDGDEQAKSEAAAATLIACQCAEARDQRIEKFSERRDEALTRFARHLSATSKATLAQTVSGNAQENVYSNFFSVHDQQCLVGLVCLEQARTMKGPDELQQASDKLAAAVTAFQNGGRDDLVGKAIRDAAMLYNEALGIVAAKPYYVDAAKHLEKAAATFEQNEEYGPAAKCRAEAAITYMKGQLLDKAREALIAASTNYEKAGRPEAQAAALKVVDSYDAGRLVDAEAEMKVIEGYCAGTDNA
ncbi:hypothetical protein AB870_23895 (plasmid) [Pandoraea faecigallinarum]|uniref:Uncharacterized protein n=1 Tax=Pandoraea faecigallinarum TaxID=656179 RepID=A0A0H3X041_9BURK|nr:hypothetical protein [Pandoraea faecigallinarum]AKM33260.1 hypothetical protein AB870_23895 [Pandoraea faecigallinarum]